MNKRHIEYHKQFLIYAIILGIIYLIIIPMFGGTDEFSHFLRIFEIYKKCINFNLNEKVLFSNSFLILKEYIQNINYENYFIGLNIPNMLEGTKQSDLLEYYWNMKLYSPFQYAPQIIGIFISSIFCKNLFIIGIFSRILGYIFWVFISYNAIKIIPNKKIFLFIVCLLPINITTAVCLSGDTLTNCICTYFIALIYRKVYLKEIVTTKEKILIILCTSMISLCKIVYLPIITLILLLKKENFKNKKSYITFLIFVIVFSITVGIIWLLIGSFNLANYNNLSVEQFKFILRNPFQYGIVIINTILSYGVKFIFELCTGDALMCQAKVIVFPIISYIYSIILMLSFFIEEKNVKVDINLFRKVWLLLIIIGICFLIITAIYIQWTSRFEVGSEKILGVQGRYFIPVILLFIFYNNNKFNFNGKPNILINMTIILQFIIIAQIFLKFI